MPTNEEILFAKIAIKNNLITEEQASKCFEVQKKLKKHGKDKSVAQILQEIGFLKEEHVEKIQTAQRKSEKVQETKILADFIQENNLASENVIKNAKERVKEEEYSRDLGQVLLDEGHINDKQYQALMERYNSTINSDTVEMPTQVADQSSPPSPPSNQESKPPSGKIKTIDSPSGKIEKKEVAGDNFEISAYMAKREKKDRIWKFLFASVGLIIAVIVIAVGYLAYSNSSHLSRAQNLASQEKFSQALDELDNIQAGGFWIDNEKVAKLKTSIHFEQDLFKVKELVKDQEYQKAKDLLKKLAKKHPAHVGKVEEFGSEIDYHKHMEAARESWRKEAFRTTYKHLTKAKQGGINLSKINREIKRLETFLAHKGQKAFQRGNYKQALVYFQHVNDIFNGNRQEMKIKKCRFYIHFQKAQKHFENNDFRTAEKEIDQARKYGTEDQLKSEEFQKLVKKFSNKRNYASLRQKIENTSDLKDKLYLLEKALEKAPPEDRNQIQAQIQRIKKHIKSKKNLKKYRQHMKAAVANILENKVDEAHSQLKEALKLKKIAEVRELINFAEKIKGMVYIPPGKFRQGSDKRGEDPVRIMDLEAYFIDRYEVTNREYKTFCDQRGYSKMKYWPTNSRHLLKRFVDKSGHPGPEDWKKGSYPSGKGAYPVVGISWYEARAFAQFQGKDLPTESQWEKAARGPLKKDTIYPWGKEFKESKTNVGRSEYGQRDKVGVTGPDVSDYGVYDLGGNVKEWVRDVFAPYPKSDYHDDYRYEGKRYRVIKGACWETPTRQAKNMTRASYRNGILPDQRLDEVGFRCVVEISPRIKSILQKYSQ